MKGWALIMSLAMTLHGCGEDLPASDGVEYASAVISEAAAAPTSSGKNPLGWTPNVRELVEILDGPEVEPFPVLVPQSMLAALEKEAVRRGRERVGEEGDASLISARSRQSKIGDTPVIITESLMMDYVVIVEIAGIIDGRLSTIICRNEAPSYIDYPTSECARRATEHFAGSVSNG